MKLKLIIILALIYNVSFAQLSTNKNFISVKKYKEAINENSSSTDVNKINEAVSYLDGNGKKIQEIAIKAGGNNEDIVQNKIYDNLNRENKVFLPLAKSGNNGSYISNFNYLQNDFYNSIKYEHTLNPYMEYRFENGVTKNVIEVSNSGNDWSIEQSHTVKTDRVIYNYDTVIDQVFNYQVLFDASNNAYLSFNDVYLPKSLIKKTIKNENWVSSDGKNNTYELFEDLNGNTILKRDYNNNVAHDTYYVYDITSGLLYFVISPEVSKDDLFDSSNNQTSNHLDLLNKFSFQYKYDYKNRLIEKKIPGKQWEYLVYDIKNRLVLSQNGIQRLSNSKEWVFIEYDSQDRIVFTGTLIDNDNNDRVELQGIMDAMPVTSVSYDSSVLFSYTHYLNQFILKVNTVNYYDNYNFDLASFSIPTSNFYSHNVNLYTKGLLTGSKIKVLNTNQWITAITLYDNKDRVIALFSKNETLNIVDKVDFKLDFSGKTIESRTVHNKTGVTNNMITFDYFKYDSNDRLFKQTQIINDKPEELITAFKYDELGKLEEKKVGGKALYWLQGVKDNEGMLFKAEADNEWESAHAHTTNFIARNGRIHFVRTLFSGASNQDEVRIGLSRNPWDTRYHEINYAFYLTSESGTPGIYKGQIMESGEVKLDFEYKEYDRFEVQRVDGRISYKINNYTIYNSEIPFGDKLYADVHFKNFKSRISNLSIDNYEYENITALQTVNYEYDIHGALKTLNNPNALDDDLFAYEIRKNSTTNATTPLFNGNISQVFWKSAQDNQLRSYDYAYDHLNRINKATFSNLDNALQNNSFNLENVLYDKNGNITFLHRAGDKMNQPNLEWMDYMNYSYNGNQLTRVAELGQNYFGHSTNIASTDTSAQYEYDIDGNLIKDRNKKIVNIVYNIDNLPILINFQNPTQYIQFLYDASGRKVSKTVVDGSNTVTTEYAAGYVYQKVNTLNAELQYVEHGEGYVANNLNHLSYVFNYKDHLSNVRVSYSDANNDGSVLSNEIIEENNYFPFGMKHSGYNSVFNLLDGNVVAQNIRFGSIEFQDEFNINVYDFQARNYEPAIGRWMNIDPLAENSKRWTPYNYTYNNPIYFVDPDGMQAEGYEWEPEYHDDGSVTYNPEPGDSAASFAKQYGLTLDVAEILTNGVGSIEVGKDAVVSGDDVRAVTGSEILKLDLASGLDTQQRKIDQVMFARAHSNSKGEATWGMNSYFKNAFSELSPSQILVGLIDIGNGRGKTTSIQIMMPFYQSLGCALCKEKWQKYETFYSNGYSEVLNKKSKNFGGGIQAINVYKIDMGFTKDKKEIRGSYMHINILTKNQYSFEKNVMDR